MAGFVLPSAHEIKEKRLFEERRTLFGKLQQGKDELYQELEALKPSTDLRVYPTKYAGDTYAKTGSGLLATWKAFIYDIVPALRQSGFVVQPVYDGKDAPWMITLP